MKHKIGMGLGVLWMVVMMMLGFMTPASAAQKAASDYWFSNSSSNPGSFDCHVYLDGKWRKINDGKTKKGLRSNTPFKCDHAWVAKTITGVTITGKLKKNKAYAWSTSALTSLDSTKWAVAFKS